MNKITKLLSVFIIAGAIGTGVAGVTACKGGDDSSTPAHTHEYTYTNNNDGTHTGVCNDGDDTKAAESHTWGTDNKCTANGCDAEKLVNSVTITTQDCTIKEGQTLTLEATVETTKGGVSTDVTWRIASGEQYASVEGNVLTATGIGTVYVEAISVADPTVKSADPVEIEIQERNYYDELVADTTNNIIGEDFQNASNFTDGKLTTYTGYENTTPGIYQWGDGNDNTSATDHYVGVVDGAAKHIAPVDDKGNSVGTTNTSLVADLTGTVKDIVEGYVELSVDATGSNWAVMALTGKSDAVTTTGEVFAIRMDDNNGKIGYRVGGKDTGKIVNSEDISFAKDAKYKVHYTLDMVSGLITVDITENGKPKKNLCTDVQTGITELKAVTFVSSNSGKRHTTIDNLAINSKDATLEEVKASLNKKVDSYVAKATVDDTLTLAGTNVTEAVAAVKSAINAETVTTVAAAKAAYTTATIDAHILANAKASAGELIDAISSTGYTGVALTELNDAKTAAKAAINAETVTTVAAVKEAYAQGKEDVEAVENDAARDKAVVNVTFTCTGVEAISGTIENKKDGDTLTLAEVRANAKGVPANKIITGIKVNGSVVALPYTLVAVDSNDDGVKDTTNLTIEVVLSDYAIADISKAPTSAGATAVNLDDNGFFVFTSAAGLNGSGSLKENQQGKRENAKSDKNTYAYQLSMTTGGVAMFTADEAGHTGGIGNAVKFVSGSACTLTMVVANKSDKTAKIKILDADGVEVTPTSIKLNGESKEAFEAAPKATSTATDENAVTYEIELPAGTYYVGGDGGGLYIYEMTVIYDASATSGAEA